MRYRFYQQYLNLYPVDMGCVIAAQLHAQERYPFESVGIVAGDMYHPLENIHPDPENEFEVDPKDVLKITNKVGPLQAVIHSHPNMPASPSKADMQSQADWGVPWGIISLEHGTVRDVVFFGDTVPIAPYVGRPFVHGVYDCFNLGRDWLRKERGIIVPQVPREDHWWIGEDRKDYLASGFTDNGWVEVDMFELQPGDALLGKINYGDVVNHCAIYLGDETILHQFYGDEQHPRLSTVEGMHTWKRYITHCLRHESALQASAS